MSRGEAAARYAKEHDVSLAEAARQFGISRERVRQSWRDLFGDEPTPVQKAQDQRVQTVAKLAEQGLSPAEIASDTGIAHNTVCDIRDRIGIPMVSGKTKVAVTDETKAKIVDLARAGKSRAEIAVETGASYSVINRDLIARSIKTRGVRGLAQPSRWASEMMDRTGCSLPEAAAKFGVSPPALWSYRKRRGLWLTKRET